MIRLALKNLAQEPGRVLISLGGVAAALVLLLLMEGIFAGVSELIVAYPQNAGADVWVMQEGVSNMHMASSLVPEATKGAIAQVPGVAEATPILYFSNFVEAGEQRWFSYIVGLPENAPRGGPWAMKEGAATPRPGEAVVPDVLARKSGLHLGDDVTIVGRRLRVAGISTGTFSMANSITFLSYEDMEGILGTPGAASYVLVTGGPEVPASVLAQRVRQRVPGVNTMTREAFIASDRSMARQMGVDVIQVMTLVGFAVGVLVVGLTMYTATANRAREYGIIKALGARGHSLLALVAFQTIVIAGLGFGAAVGIAYLAGPLIQMAMPEIAVLYPASGLARLAVASLGIAFLASLLPAYRISRVEPAVVFKE
ncbi:MAG: ABC transporter permease [Chloroflexi bacterium]|nr:ABC transporter permease [Chloroflexota bacterium]